MNKLRYNKDTLQVKVGPLTDSKSTCACTLLLVISADANLIICFPKPSESVLSVSLIIFDADFKRTTLCP